MSVPMTMRMTVVWTSVGLGVEGLFSSFGGPGVDLLIIAGAWVVMVVRLASQAGHVMSKARARKLCTAIAVSMGGFLGGTKAAITAFAYTGIGTIPAMVANGGLNGVITYVVGIAIAETFLQSDEISSIDALARSIVSIVAAQFGWTRGV